jgi:uncharacterized protein (TIGR02996 family)
MTNRDALLAAIRADPDDDVPRLVYADWLDEHGQPERAELIRVQCALAPLPSGDARLESLRERERALLSTHRRAWAAELPPLDGVRWGPFERGFVARAEFRSLKAFAERFEEAACYAPLVIADLRDLSARAVVRLAALPVLRLVRRLVLVDCRPDAACAGALAGSPHVEGLRGLWLTGGSTGDAGALALAASPHLGALHTLSLCRAAVGPAGALALVANPNLGSLRRLYLSRNPIGDMGADALLASVGLDRLEELFLDNCGIDRDRAESLRQRVAWVLI